MTEAEQYPVQIPMPPSMPYLSPRDQYGSSIETLTNPENEIERLKLSLMGFEIDKDGNMVKSGEPLMNKRGINSVIKTTQSVVNQVTILSNLDKDEIKKLMEFLSYTLAKDLMVNRVNYGIQSFSERSNIYSNVLTTSFITMKRAETEGLSDKKFWRGSVQELHSTVSSNQQKKGGWLSNLWKH